MADDPNDLTHSGLMEHILGSEAETPVGLRQAAARNADVPDDLAALVDKIHRHAYKVTDEDVEQARRQYSEDELFDIIVSAALGASCERLTAALRVIEGAQ